MNATQDGGQLGGQEGLSSAQHAALDSWAIERGIEITDLQTLKSELSSSTDRRAEVFGASDGIEILEEKGLIGKTIDFFRDHIGKVLIGMGIMGAATGLYVGKQAIDAASKTSKDAMGIAIAQIQEEFGEKTKEIEKFAKEAYEISSQLMMNLLIFLSELQKSVDEFAEIQSTAMSLWDGLKEDGAELWNSKGKDRSPDKIMGKVSGMIDDNPELKAQWEKVKDSMEQIKEIPEQLKSLKDDTLTFEGLPENFSEATWDKFEENFKKELFHPFQQEDSKAKKAA